MSDVVTGGTGKVFAPVPKMTGRVPMNAVGMGRVWEITTEGIWWHTNQSL